MSSLIQPPQGPGATVAGAAVRGSEAAGRITKPGATARVAQGPAVSFDTTPSAPPAEVFEAMQAAAGAYDSLQSQGLEVNYSHDPLTSRTSAELRDGSGALVRTLSASEAVALAAGEPVAGG